MFIFAANPANTQLSYFLIKPLVLHKARECGTNQLFVMIAFLSA
jgi:hypothetical protein